MHRGIPNFSHKGHASLTCKLITTKCILLQSNSEVLKLTRHARVHTCMCGSRRTCSLNGSFTFGIFGFPTTTFGCWFRMQAYYYCQPGCFMHACTQSVKTSTDYACRDGADMEHLGTDAVKAILKCAMFFVVVNFSQLALHGLASKEAIESIRQG